MNRFMIENIHGKVNYSDIICTFTAPLEDFKGKNVNAMNNNEKFEQIFNRMFPKVKAFFRKILQSEAEAEDIAQDVFVKLLNTPEVWENDEDWDNYIYTVARNLIYNHLKHKVVEQKYIQHIATDNDYLSADDIHEQLYAKELQILARLTISRMPEQRRKVFCMSRLEGMSHIEIAEKLGISVRTVERHIYLALGELKKALYFLFIVHFIE